MWRWSAFTLLAAGLPGCLSVPSPAPGSDAGVTCDDGPFAERFLGNMLDEARWNATMSSGGGMAVVDDGLLLDASPLSGAYGVAEIYSQDEFAVEGTSLVVELSVEVADAGDAFVGWWNHEDGSFVGLAVVEYANGERISIGNGHVGQGDLELQCAGPCPSYEPSDMRWVRLRRAEGSASFDASADGTTWKPINQTVDAPAAPASILLWAECEYPNVVQSSVRSVSVGSCD